MVSIRLLKEQGILSENPGAGAMRDLKSRCYGQADELSANGFKRTH